MRQLGSTSSERTIESWLIETLAHAMDRDSGAVSATEEFADLGVTSLVAAAMLAKIEARYRVKVEPTIFWTHPTVERMARHLATVGEEVN